MKKLFTLAAAAAFGLSLAFPASAAPAATGPIIVTVNNHAVVWTDARPFINEYNRTMVPLRPVAEAMGLSVQWDDDRKEATFYRDAKAITFRADSNIARTYTTGDIEMDTPAMVFGGRTYAPALYLAQYFGYAVVWYPGGHTVAIYDPVTRSGPPPSVDTPTGGSTSSFHAESVMLDKSEITMYVSESNRVTAKVFPNSAIEDTVYFYSTDEQVVTVSSKGIIYAHRVGVAEIIAETNNGKTASCKVTVRRSRDSSESYFYDHYYDSYRSDDYTPRFIYPEEIVLYGSSVELTQDDTYKIRAEKVPYYADGDIYYYSQDSTVASVDWNGVVTAKNPGFTRIVVEGDGGAFETFSVTVKQKPITESNTKPQTSYSVSLSESAINLGVGQTGQLSASVTPESASDARVTWASENSEIAMVSEKGLVIGVSPGETTVSAKLADGTGALCKVTVLAPETAVSETAETVEASASDA